MSIEALGGNSQENEHVWLKNPFTPKQITLNSHTPLDEQQDDKAVTQKDFIGKYRSTKAAVYKADEDKYSFGMKNGTNEKEDEAVKFESSSEMIENSKVGSFQASNLSAKDIVSGRMKRGDSVDEAYTAYKTQKAYETSVGKSKSPIHDLGTRKFRTHG